MADADSPGWRPDPERPGMLRWWNGLGWSDARKAAAGSPGGTFGVRPAAEDALRRADRAVEAARQSTVTPASVLRGAGRTGTAVGSPAPPAEVPVPLAGSAAALRALNPAAGVAMVLGVLGFLFGGGVWLIPLAGLIVSLVALARSRRLARRGERRTGLRQSITGLLLSAVGLTHWIPVLVGLVSTIRFD